MAKLHAVIRSKNLVETEFKKKYIDEIIDSRTSHISLKQYPSLNERLANDFSYIISEINNLKSKLSELEK